MERGGVRALPSESAASERGGTGYNIRRDHTADGSSNEFRGVGVELRHPLQSTCSQRSTASRLARLAACSACKVEHTLSR